MENNIIIQNKATIKANGELNSRKCKRVICIDTGEVFTSAKDAAKKAGVHFSTMSAVCLGKLKTAGGKRYCYLSDAMENLDAIVCRLRETSSVEEDARKWRAYQAQQEAARKEKERRQAEVSKVEEQLARQNAICERLQAQLTRAEQRRVETENRLNELKGKED